MFYFTFNESKIYKSFTFLNKFQEKINFSRYYIFFLDVPLCNIYIYTRMHLADAFIQSDLQCIQVIHLLSVYVFPGNLTHDLCAANAMLYHWATGTQNRKTVMDNPGNDTQY